MVNVDVVNNNLTDIGKIIYEKEINLTGVVITPHNLSWCAAQYYTGVYLHLIPIIKKRNRYLIL